MKTVKKIILWFIILTGVYISLSLSWIMGMIMNSSKVIDPVMDGRLCPYPGKKGEQISNEDSWDCRIAESKYRSGMKKVKEKAYQDGYQDFLTYGERKEPRYPTRLTHHLFLYTDAPQPINGKEEYDEFYEKGYKEALNNE